MICMPEEDLDAARGKRGKSGSFKSRGSSIIFFPSFLLPNLRFALPSSKLFIWNCCLLFFSSPLLPTYSFSCLPYRLSGLVANDRPLVLLSPLIPSPSQPWRMCQSYSAPLSLSLPLSRGSPLPSSALPDTNPPPSDSVRHGAPFGIP